MPRAKKVANHISGLKNEETGLVASLNEQYALKIISSAEKLTINGVISLINSDAFAEDLAYKLKYDERELNKMTSYYLSQNYFYGMVLKASLTKDQLCLGYNYSDINVFSGRKVSDFYNSITAKTKRAIDKYQNDLPF